MQQTTMRRLWKGERRRWVVQRFLDLRNGTLLPPKKGCCKGLQIGATYTKFPSKPILIDKGLGKWWTQRTEIFLAIFNKLNPNSNGKNCPFSSVYGAKWRADIPLQAPAPWNSCQAVLWFSYTRISQEPREKINISWKMKREMDKPIIIVKGFSTPL